MKKDFDSVIDPGGRQAAIFVLILNTQWNIS